MMMYGQSEKFLALRALLGRFARCDAPVLIDGETGTGKELAAREIHYAGARSSKPFVPVNCGALPDTLIESELFGHRRGAFTDAKTTGVGMVDCARGGTLFLDEVDTLSMKAQVTLLRFLQDRQYRPVGGGQSRVADVRIIAATNSALEDLVAEGKFRADLLYRLNPLHVRIPPLRERRDDIVLLADHFLREAALAMRMPAKRWSDAAVQLLVAYAWPGNIRELENVSLRACLSADATEVGVDALFAAESALLRSNVADASVDDCGTFSSAKSRAVALFERTYLTDLMQRASGNISAAATMSGTERRQLGKLLKKHQIEARRFHQ
ncbi:MAG TPA: sigma-54 dependent transcriptional regulator [Rudaea sp.]|nr:sigma-54 dependent transcriptional regulator [Rudaea sp.]